MKADISRSTFDQRKHFSAVLRQMGRVPVDADANEASDIALHRVETETIDVVGESGGPIHAAAFQIAAIPADLPPDQQAAATALGPLAPGDFLLSAGRYYVNGVMCENDAPIRFSDQAAGDFPDAAPLANAGLYLLYLDVWSRHITHLDDRSIREVALGGPDTATRVKTVWQVRALRVGGAQAAPACGAPFAAYDQETAPSTGTLAAEVDPTPDPTDPCVLPPRGGFRRLENQLYRVEIHDGGPEGAGATFKWSRDNGAVVSGWAATSAPNAIRLTNPPRDQVMGFAVGNWVELTDDDDDLLGDPGLLIDITRIEGDTLTLGANAPAGPLRNPKVRRWDGVFATAVVAGNWIPLEDGVRVRFSSGTYRTGDYWTIPARTATADVEWPRDANGALFRRPLGITHGYSRLGFVAFDGTTVVPTDCRVLFPPLTEIDEGVDLKRHNRDLHGKGVVCGFQVRCVGSDRTLVSIRPGHAIDCAGTDILLETPARLDIVDRAKALGLLDAAGTGDVELTLRADAEDNPVFNLRAAEPEPTNAAGILRKILEGTIWRDFYDDCLKPLADFVRDRLFDEDPNDPAPVSAQKKRLLTVLNLLAHRAAGVQNRRLWLSAEQHALLEELYTDLRKLASRSPTFCAILDDLPEFPEFPFGDQPIRTAFVARKVVGARMIPETPLAIAWSEDAAGHIHVFDLESGEMVRDMELKAAAGLDVQDVAVVAIKERPVIVVSAANANQTVLTVLDIKAERELDAVVIAGSRLTRLEPHTRRPGVLLALEPGRGLHFLEVARLASAPLDAPPKWQFPAVAHLAVLNDRVCATANPTGTGTEYAAFRVGRLGVENDVLDDRVFRLGSFNDNINEGEDGLSLATGSQTLILHVVVNMGDGSKSVLVVDAERMRGLGFFPLPRADDGGETGPVRVSSLQRPGRFVYALAKRNQLVWTPADSIASPAALTLPAQAEPVAVVNVPPANVPQLVIAANRESMTLTLTPAKLIGNLQLPDQRIIAYRDALLEAFERLLRVIVQGLKDCLCEHLLVDCPVCEPGEVLRLAKVEIVENRVRHICNIDRQEVLTFPKVKYWLSTVPIIPLVAYLVDRFCCWIITQPAKPAPGGVRPVRPVVSPAVALGSLDLVRRGRLEEMLTDNLERAKIWTKFTAGSAGTKATVTVPPKPSGVRLTEVIDADRGVATTKLAERGVSIAAVEDYDEALSRGDKNISVSKLPPTLEPGASVKLFTRGDKVLFYQVVSPVDTRPPSSPVGGADLASDLADLKGQLVQLRAAQSQAGATRDRDLAELKLADVNLDAEIKRVAATAPPTELKTTMDSLRQELASLRESHANELAVRDRQLAELRSANDKLASTLDVQTRKLQADIDRLGRVRPPG